jgi:hypothetical protein
MEGHPLCADLKKELLKSLNSRVFDGKLLFDEMPCLNDVEKAIKALREKYSNDNTLPHI